MLLNIGGKNLVIDAGARMGAGKDYLPDLSMIQENGGVDAILISHAHMDHSGSLPILSRGKMPLPEEMALLWEFVMKQYSTSLGPAWEELAYIWSGQKEFPLYLPKLGKNFWR